MKLKAIGRHLLIRMDVEAIEEKTAGGIILAQSVVDKERGGVQMATVLDVGEFAFDDQPGVKICRGDKIVTQRYPGSALDLNQNWTDEEASRFRVILDNEVRAVVNNDGVELQ